MIISKDTKRVRLKHLVSPETSLDYNPGQVIKLEDDGYIVELTEDQDVIVVYSHNTGSSKALYDALEYITAKIPRDMAYNDDDIVQVEYLDTLTVLYNDIEAAVDGGEFIVVKDETATPVVEPTAIAKPYNPNDYKELELYGNF